MRGITIMVLGLLIAAPAHAATVCKRIGHDPYSTQEELFLSGPTGGFGYNSHDGSREMLTDLQCAYTFKPGPSRGVVCMRVFNWGKGLTVEHYGVSDLAGIAALSKSTFTQNGGTAGDKHSAFLDSFMVECSVSP